MAEPLRRLERIEVTGIVQGVGFRPFVHNLAQAHGLAGYVLNNPDGVVIEVEGASDELEAFAADLPSTGVISTRSSTAPTAGRVSVSSRAYPTTARSRPCRSSRCVRLASGNMTIPATAGSTRSLTPAPSAGLRCSLWMRRVILYRTIHFLKPSRC